MSNRWRFRLNLALLFAALVLVSTIASLPSVHAPPNPIVWVAKSPIPYHTAQAGVVGGMDGRIYVFGGYASVSPSTPVTTARAYDPRTDTWANLTSLPTPTRGPGIAVDNSGLIYVITGFSGVTDIANNQVYNVTSNSWTAGTSIPTGVWMPGAATGIDGRIYVVGGEISSGTSTNLLQIYNTQTKVWSSGATLGTARKQFQAVAAPNGLIYAIGGMNSGGSAIATVEAYNITANSWTPKASMPSAVMVFGATLGPDGLIYVFGGSNTYTNNGSPFFNTVYSYDPVSNTWYTNIQNLPTPRRELSAATSSYNNRMYVMGGANGTYLNTNEEASISNGHTTVTTVTCSPSTVVANDVTSCNATVTDTNSTAATTPTGTVSFLSSGTGTFTGTCTLTTASSSSATCASPVTYRPTAVGTGSHIIRGTYSGDSTHNPSISTGSQSFTLTVTFRSTSTAVTCSPSSVLVNSGSTCTATVTDTATSGISSTPTSTVSFTAAGSATGSFSSASCSLSLGSCAVTFTPHTAGGFTVTGNYGGDAMHSSSSGISNSVTVTLRTTSIALSCNPTSTLANNSTKCTVTVTDTSPAPFTTPTGTITLSTSGTGTFSTCTLSGSGAVATCSTTYTPTNVGTGSHILTAHYGGDAAHSAANPDQTATITVTPRTTVTSVSCTSPATVGTPTNCTATVTDNSIAGAFITPTGTVSLASSGAGVFSTCTLSGSTASATCSATFTPFGTNATTNLIGANYPGDNNHSGSGSFLLTVNGSGGPNAAPVAAIGSITPNPVQLGQAITFTGSGTDSDGSIIAYKWRSSISGTLSSQASFQTSGLPAGNHTIYFSVEDNQGAWSQEVSTVVVITSSTNGANSAPASGLPTMDWIILACALGGIGVFVGYLIGRKRKKQVSRIPPVFTAPSAPPTPPASAPPTAAPTAAPSANPGQPS
jgi:N-acetylneuraminic acid mutarotase